MDIEKTLMVVNELVADAVIKDFALGGAIAAIFYTEPIDTQDVDIFVQVIDTGINLAILSPIYDYMRARGYNIEAEHIFIEGFPVQFLPAFNALTDEAVTEALEVELQTVKTRIMRPEHLVAIMLDTGRLKDYLRIDLFLRSEVVDRAKLQDIVERHELTQKWSQNKYRFEQ